MKKEFCPHCTQPVMQHRQSFNVSMANMLLKVALRFREGQPFHLQKDLELTKNQYNNFQKLKYWDLIEKHYENGKRVWGCWHLTKEVREFFKGRPLRKTVTTFNNKVVEVSEETIELCEAVGHYDIPEIWAQNATPAITNQDEFNFNRKG